MPTLGIDIGGVIIDVWGDGNMALLNSDDYLSTPEVMGALQAIQKLRQLFGGRLYYISAGDEENHRRFTNWLEAHDFFGMTGPKLQDVYYCAQPGEKQQICEQLGITSFIDDTLDVLNCLTTVTNKYLLSPSKKYKTANLPGNTSAVQSWAELLLVIESQ